LSLGLPASDRESEALELFSEVMAKLLGAASLPRDVEAEAEMVKTGDALGRPEPGSPESPDGILATAPDEWMINDDPRRDRRVVWLIEATGGRRALAHRYEDMRRQRWGRWRESGYRMVQIASLQGDTHEIGASEDEVLARHADRAYLLHQEQEDSREAEDVRRAWTGLLVLAERQFAPGDDVSLLLQVLVGDAEVQAGFGSAWPVGQIVRSLNGRHPDRPWSDDRVDNAKKRLKNWIGRIKRDQGLDAVDLRALLVGVARQQESRAEGIGDGQLPARTTPKGTVR